MGILQSLENGAGNALKAVEDAASGAGHAVAAAAQGVGDAAGHVFHGTVDGLKAEAKGLGHAAVDLGHGVVQAGHDVAEGAQHGDVLGGVLHAGGDLAKAGGHGLDDAWHGTTEAAGHVLNEGLAAVRSVGVGMGRAYDAGVAGVSHAVGDVAGRGAGEAVRGVAEGIAAPVRTVVNGAFGVAGALAHGVEGMAAGTGDIVVGAVRMGSDSEFRDKMIAKMGDGMAGLIHVAEGAIADPKAALGKVEAAARGAAEQFKEAGLKAGREGHEAEWVGEQIGGAAFQVLSTLQPLAKVGAVAGAAVKGAEIVGNLGRDAEVVAKVGGEVRVAGDAAKGATAAGDAVKVGTEAAGKAPRARGYAQDVPGGEERGVPSTPGEVSKGEVPAERGAPPTAAGGGDAGAKPPTTRTKGTGGPSGPGDGSPRRRKNADAARQAAVRDTFRDNVLIGPDVTAEDVEREVDRATRWMSEAEVVASTSGGMSMAIHKLPSGRTATAFRLREDSPANLVRYEDSALNASRRETVRMQDVAGLPRGTFYPKVGLGAGVSSAEAETAIDGALQGMTGVEAREYMKASRGPFLVEKNPQTGQVTARMEGTGRFPPGFQRYTGPEVAPPPVRTGTEPQSPEKGVDKPAPTKSRNAPVTISPERLEAQRRATEEHFMQTVMMRDGVTVHEAGAEVEKLLAGRSLEEYDALLKQHAKDHFLVTKGPDGSITSRFVNFRPPYPDFEGLWPKLVGLDEGEKELKEWNDRLTKEFENLDFSNIGDMLDNPHFDEPSLD